jgi:predicted AlkP superfamily phosphohydrolase/phosphomutase
MPNSPRSRRWFLLVCSVALVSALGGMAWIVRNGAKHAETRPFLLVGVDGGEWRVVRHLWQQGKMQNLRRISDAGSSASLKTAYGPSPVIWTTVATGLKPTEHGITDFVVSTPRGDAPVSSTLRKAPALWNMVSQVGRRVVALGWWGSWPAEEVNGVVVSDRVGLGLGQTVYPPDFQPRLEQWVAASARDFDKFVRSDPAQNRDFQVAVAARGLAGEKQELTMVYFRSPDIVSHVYWKYFDPKKFPPIPPAEMAAHGDKVTRSYEAFDDALGAILEAAGGLRSVNVIVLSDHGFRPELPERVQVQIDFDQILQRLGYLVKGPDGVDFARSTLFGVGSAPHHPVKKVRFALAGRDKGGLVQPGQREALRQKLTRDLERVRYSSGVAVFHVRDASPGEIGSGADFTVTMERNQATPKVLIDDVEVKGLVLDFHTLTGTHGPRTNGLFFAAGPDIGKGTKLPGISIHDIAPTVLYALGLPYGRDFAGRPRVDLFTEAFRRRHPLRAVSSWGRRNADGPTESGADEALVDELRALGYLD